MIQIAICDDEPRARAWLSSLIKARGVPCDITEYENAAQLLAGKDPVDLIFLDVELDPAGMDGMELARQLRARNQERQPVIVFVTGYERYVFDAFDVEAFQYLLKPVDEERFGRVFDRAVERIEAGRRIPPKPRTLTVQTGGESRAIPLDRIRYIESSNHKVVLCLTNGQMSYYARITDLEKQLAGDFFRIHKGYLVNLNQIEGYSKTEVFVKGGGRLLLSKYKYRDFAKAYLRRLKEGEA